MTINRKQIKVLSLVVGLILLALSGINWHSGFAALLSPAFILYYTRSSTKRGLWLLFIGGFLAGGISRTSFVVMGNFLPMFISNGLIFVIPFVVPFIIDKWLNKDGDKFIYTLLFPSAVVILEYVVSSTIGSWGIIAHNISINNPLIQSVSLIGLQGLSFLIMWFGTILNWAIEHGKLNKTTITPLLGYFALIILFFVYGLIRVSVGASKRQIKVATVQGKTNILKVFTDFASEFEMLAKDSSKAIPDSLFCTEQTVLDLISSTKQALDNDAKIVVWNEDAAILDTIQQEHIKSKVCHLAKEYKAYVLISFLAEAKAEQKKPFNNLCVLTTPEGKIAFEYMKSGLHPTGELPFINQGDFIMSYYDTEYGRVGSLICYDMDILRLSKQTRKNDIDIMLLPSYDWDAITPLHSHMAAVEAIQNGFVLIRPDGNGYSQVYDNKGRSLLISSDKVNPQIAYGKIPIERYRGIPGNIIVYLAISVVLLFILKKNILTKHNI